MCRRKKRPGCSRLFLRILDIHQSILPFIHPYTQFINSFFLAPLHQESVVLYTSTNNYNTNDNNNKDINNNDQKHPAYYCSSFGYPLIPSIILSAF